jgi:hypothetical protein
LGLPATLRSKLKTRSIVAAMPEHFNIESWAKALVVDETVHQGRFSHLVKLRLKLADHHSSYWANLFLHIFPTIFDMGEPEPFSGQAPAETRSKCCPRRNM